MRNTDSGGNTSETIAFSSCALFRSWPNGFSTTTRRQRACGWFSARPCSLSWPITSGKNRGGIDR